MGIRLTKNSVQYSLTLFVYVMFAVHGQDVFFLKPGKLFFSIDRLANFVFWVTFSKMFKHQVFVGICGYL